MTHPPTEPLPPAADPWEGRARVPDGAPMPPTGVMPQVVFVEVRRKRRWPWVLGIFGLLCAICCGLCAFATIPVWEQYPSKIRHPMPEQVGSLKRDGNGVVRAVALAAADRIRLEWNIDDAFADNYVDPKSGQRHIVTFGATLLLWNPGGDLDATIQREAHQLSGVKTYPPGDLGGYLKCANGKDAKDDKPLVYCAWADHGSVGMNICYGQRPMDECAAFLREVRERIIIRP